MRKLKVLLASGLVVSSFLISVIPALADTTTAATTSTTNPNAAYWTQIKELRQQDKALGEQLQGLNQSIIAQEKVDQQQKNYTALLSAVNDRISVENDADTALADQLNLRKDTLQLQIDRQAKNEQGIATDLQNIITDLQNQISIRQQRITDAQKILADLGGSATGTTTSSSTGVNPGGPMIPVSSDSTNS